MAQARESLARGRAYFNADNYDAAIAEFERVYDLLGDHPSRPNVLFNIGQCHERRFRYDEALRIYRRYLQETAADAQDRTQVVAQIATLESLLGSIVVRVNASDAEIWVDERLIGRGAGTFAIPGGLHTVEARAQGYVPSLAQVRLPARAERTITLRLESVRRLVSPAGFGVSMGVGSAALVASGATALLWLDNRNRLAAAAADPVRAYTLYDGQLQTRAANLALATDVLLAVGVAGVVTSLVLLPFTQWRRERDPSAIRAGLVVAPLASGDAGGLALGGVL